MDDETQRRQLGSTARLYASPFLDDVGSSHRNAVLIAASALILIATGLVNGDTKSDVLTIKLPLVELQLNKPTVLLVLLTVATFALGSFALSALRTWRRWKIERTIWELDSRPFFERRLAEMPAALARLETATIKIQQALERSEQLAKLIAQAREILDVAYQSVRDRLEASRQPTLTLWGKVADEVLEAFPQDLLRPEERKRIRGEIMSVARDAVDHAGFDKQVLQDISPVLCSNLSSISEEILREIEGYLKIREEAASAVAHPEAFSRILSSAISINRSMKIALTWDLCLPALVYLAGLGISLPVILGGLHALAAKP